MVARYPSWMSLWMSKLQKAWNFDDLFLLYPMEVGDSTHGQTDGFSSCIYQGNWRMSSCKIIFSWCTAESVDLEKALSPEVLCGVCFYCKVLGLLQTWHSF